MADRVAVNLNKVEQACDVLIDVHIQLIERLGLNGIERNLVLARVAYIHDRAIERALSQPNDRAEYERVRAVLHQRCEDTRAANQAASATGVNSEGGDA